MTVVGGAAGRLHVMGGRGRVGAAQVDHCGPAATTQLAATVTAASLAGSDPPALARIRACRE